VSRFLTAHQQSAHVGYTDYSAIHVKYSDSLTD